MSYTVKLKENGDVVSVERCSEDGIIDLFNRHKAELYVTYNYSPHFKKIFGKWGIRFLDGKRAGLCIKVLKKAVINLGTKRECDPWKWSSGCDLHSLSTLFGRLNYLAKNRIFGYNCYWESTPGNAGYALSIMLDWAEQHPNSVFEVNG